MKIKQLISELDKYNVELADKYFLVKVFFSISPYQLPLKMDKEVDDNVCNLILDKIKKEVPIPYICERCVFLGNTILLNYDTLIPRVETEELASRIINMFQNQNTDKYKILDLCSGSGCIGLSLAKNFPKSKVTFIDISSSAINISKQSAKLNGIKNVKFILNNFIDNIKNVYDIIVCNPPYIPEDTKTITKHEPELALFSGADGMDAFRSIFSNLDNITKKGSICFFEFDSSYASKMKTLFYSLVKEKYNTDIVLDMSKKPRFFVAERI